jgi:uncharacterized pyridoxamine 5'-phosphate oxidase family protein
MSIMTKHELLQFLRRYKIAVQSTVSPGGPQCAVVGFAVSDAFEIIFDTLESTRKYKNLCADSRIAIVVGWDDAITVQIEGTADFPKRDELERIRECYFKTYPDGRDRLAWAGITHVRVRPDWIRYSNFSVEPPLVIEFAAEHLGSQVGH